MEKINTTSENIENENLEKLRKVFPEFVKDGVIDFDELKKFFKDEEILAGEEKYGLNWAGKSNAFKSIRMPATGTLVPDEKESVDWEKTENIFIEGDNLEILKLLRKKYRGQIKMIYIDPPYNTGKDFVYKDNFKENVSNYYERTGQSEGGIKMSSNLESNGRYHSDWLTMMYPRLFLTQNLLRDDGVIFVSIDDNEVANLRLIMDEIFGEENFVAQIVWQTTQKNDPKFVAINHEYILVYFKNAEELKNKDIKWRIPHPLVPQLQNEYDKIKKRFGDELEKIQEKWNEIIKKDKYKALSHYKYIDKKGVYFAADISDPQRSGPIHNFVIHPVTKKICVAPSGGYSPREEEMRRRLKDDEIHFGPTHEFVVCYKKYLLTAEDRISSVYYEDGRRATKELEKILDKSIFDHPKSEILIGRLAKFVTKGNDIILDFFSGSGTTAHAIMEINAEDNENRKCISIQIPEILDCDKKENKAACKFLESIKKPKNIAEICKERIRRAGAKIRKGDVGFKAFTLSKSNYRQWNVLTEKDNVEKLKEQMKLFLEKPLIDGFNEKSVVYEILVKEGFDLNANVFKSVIPAKAEIQKFEIWTVEDGERKMVVIFANKITKEQVESLGLKEQDIFVCLDSALDDTTKINIARNLIVKTI